MNISDQLGQIAWAQGVVADIGRDDFGAELDQVLLISDRRAGGVTHISTFQFFLGNDLPITPIQDY
jgi:hypothetical protein